jgi:hypothetical protein
MSSSYRAKVPRAVGDRSDAQGGGMGGDKDRRIPTIDPDASMYNRYGQGKPQAPKLSDANVKRIEEIHEMPNEKSIYTKVKARYQ